MRLKRLNFFETFCIALSFLFASLGPIYASDCPNFLRHLGEKLSDESSEVVYLQAKADKMFPEIEAMREHLQKAGEEYLLRQSDFGFEFQILPSKTRLGRIADWLKERFGAEIVYAPLSLGNEEVSFTLNRSIFISHREFQNLAVDESFDHEIQHLAFNVEFESLKSATEEVLMSRVFDLPIHDSGYFSFGLNEILVTARDLRRLMTKLFLLSQEFKNPKEMLMSSKFLELERIVADKTLTLQEIIDSFEVVTLSLEDSLEPILSGKEEPQLEKFVKLSKSEIKLKWKSRDLFLSLRPENAKDRSSLVAEMKMLSFSEEQNPIILTKWNNIAGSFFKEVLKNPEAALHEFKTQINGRLLEWFDLIIVARDFQKAAARALWMTRALNLKELRDFLLKFPDDFSVSNQESIDRFMDHVLSESRSESSQRISLTQSIRDHIFYSAMENPRRFVASEDLNLSIELSLRGISKILFFSQDSIEIDRFRELLELTKKHVDFQDFLAEIKDDVERFEIFQNFGESGYLRWRNLALGSGARSLLMTDSFKDWSSQFDSILKSRAPSVVLLKSDLNQETNFSLELKRSLISRCFDEKTKDSGAFMSLIFNPSFLMSELQYRARPAFYFLANDLRFEDQMKRDEASNFLRPLKVNEDALHVFRGKFVSVVSKTEPSKSHSGFLVFDSQAPYLKLRSSSGELTSLYFNFSTHDLFEVEAPKDLKNFLSKQGSHVRLKSQLSGDEHFVFLKQILDIRSENDGLVFVWQVETQAGSESILHFKPNVHEILSR
ncbi:MAG: hypothetical protein ACO3LE_04050 [Bdellovibrionota bacterium]